MKALFKKWFLGITIPQEYICVGLQGLSDTLSISITGKNKIEWLDATKNQLFLGYKPLLLAVYFRNDEKSISMESEVCLHFNPNPFKINSTWSGAHSDNKSIARIRLKKIEQKSLENFKINFYRGEKGWHNFISIGHQKLNALLHGIRKNPQSNVNLPGNLYDQVRIAYSIPRTISLITVSNGQQMNLFPTDLHGPVGEKLYLGSLRIGGEACRQVQEFKRIVISEIEALQFNKVYNLGKRHMQPMTDPSDFKLSSIPSSTFNFPLPEGVGLYRELEMIDYFDEGIHRIFIYKIVHIQSVKEFDPLAHIHRYYVQWRLNNGLSTPMLLR